MAATTTIGAAEPIEWPWLNQRALFCDEYGIGTTGSWTHLMQIPITIRISDAASGALTYQAHSHSLLTELRLFAVTDTGEEHKITCVKNSVFTRSGYPPASDWTRCRVKGTWPPEREVPSDSDDDEYGLSFEEEKAIIEQYWPMYELNVMPHRVDPSDGCYYDPFRGEDPSYRLERFMMSFSPPKDETSRIVGFKAKLVQGTYGRTDEYPAETVVRNVQGSDDSSIQDGLVVTIDTVGRQRWHLPSAKIEVKLEYPRFATKAMHEPDESAGNKRVADGGDPPPAKRSKR